MNALVCLCGLSLGSRVGYERDIAIKILIVHAICQLALWTSSKALIGI